MSYIAWFEETSRQDAPLVGGKGANLGEMARAGLPVPPGYVVTVDAFRAFVKENALAQENLRRRVPRMAEMHNRHRSRGGMMQGPGGDPGARSQGREHGAPGGRGPHGGGMMGGQEMMMMTMIPADARAEEIESGARIVFTPRDPGELGALREQVRHSAERMASGQCPMMSGEATQPPAPEDASEHKAHHPEGESD